MDGLTIRRREGDLLGNHELGAGADVGDGALQDRRRPFQRLAARERERSPARDLDREQMAAVVVGRGGAGIG